MTAESVAALVIGGGPAGLMAASALLDFFPRVVLAEAKPSIGRKLLMAGKSGLNLTKDEPAAQFVAQYAEAAGWLAPMIDAFGPAHARHWARELGQEVFTGSSGRVFPVSMKASPLLRAWLAALGSRGLDQRTGWRWTGITGNAFDFETREGPRRLFPQRTVLALGGASWSRLGSDGSWAPILSRAGVALAAFQPANMGFFVDWTDHMRALGGKPLKAVVLSAGSKRVRAEAMITERGIEGGGIYALSRAIRDGAPLFVDLVPDLSHEQAIARLARRPASESVSNSLRKALGLGGLKLALLNEFARPLPSDHTELVRIVKSLRFELGPPFPMDEAISTAGGIRRDALDEDLMLRRLPGVFAAGEMLDWEAPTGGYLLTACLATGLWAGRAAASWSPGHDRDANHQPRGG